MELNALRSAMTLISLLVFLGIVVWAWKGRRRDAFDAAAQLPFADDETPEPAQRSQGANQ
ncbi:cbb3-type cytochrome c oxidase subunit 3 [Ideonella sp. DXS22W]|uniref:Cbb3-type cytochrome c oxidase subunit 3 n=1 Tax=Pseudaquabacterium inlustre TaxID=2984192 RepID=A0ABU9CG51_9BURK